MNIMGQKEIKKILSKCAWRHVAGLRDELLGSQIRDYKHFRILPNDDPQPFWYEAPIHYLKHILPCTRVELDMCPVCEHAAYRWKMSEEMNSRFDWEIAKHLFRKERYMFNVINRFSSSVEQMMFGAVVKKMLVSMILDRQALIYDLIRGYDIHLFKTGIARETRFFVFMEKKPSHAMNGKNVEESAALIKEAMSYRKKGPVMTLERVTELQRALEEYLSEVKIA